MVEPDREKKGGEDMISILTPVRPDSDYIEGFLQHLVANITDKGYVEVILAITLGDKGILEKIEPFRSQLNITTIEIEKSIGRTAFHTWLTILSHASHGWALVFLSDDIRPEGRKLDEVFKELELKYHDLPVIFYLNGLGAYPSMTRVWFDNFGWGPHYGVDTFLNTITKMIPKCKVDVSGIDLKDLNGETRPIPEYKPMEYPSSEFDSKICEFVSKVANYWINI